jgi:DNA repair protein RecN (Recombination protein N)
MLRSLSIRNFVIVDELELEFGPGFTVLTGETGAGKSILLDALDLLLGERSETAMVRAGAERAELAAEFSIEELPLLGAWLAEHDLAGEEDTLLLRRVLDAGGRSRAYVNGHPVTLAQLREAAESLVDIHGQHAHQSLLKPEAQRLLLDSFGGFTVLARETAAAWQRWRDAHAARERATRQAAALAAERDALGARHEELVRLGVSEAEWTELTRTQRRLANAAGLIAAAEQGVQELAEDDGAIVRRLGALLGRLRDARADDPALAEVVDLLEPAHIQAEEAARALRAYRQRADLDPAELARVEERLGAVHDAARKYRVRPEQIPQLAAATAARLAELESSIDDAALARTEDDARAAYDQLADQLSAKRRFAANELAHRGTRALQTLAMPGGTLAVDLAPRTEAASHGREDAVLTVSTHPAQPPGPLARVASGGELSRISLAIQVVTSETAQVPSLVFDEVDVGIGGGVAEIVGRLLQQLGTRRQVICVTHLAQVAACADRHYRVSKRARADAVATRIERIDGERRAEEIARMMGGVEVTEKTREHAREMLASSRREAARPASAGPGAADGPPGSRWSAPSSGAPSSGAKRRRR